MSIDHSEIAKLAADLTTASATITHKADAALRKTAYDIETTAKQICPVDTGFLRNSIGVSTAYNVAIIGPTAYYAPFVEYGVQTGSRQQAAQPFMTPAAEKHLPYLQKALEQLGIESILGRGGT